MLLLLFLAALLTFSGAAIIGNRPLPDGRIVGGTEATIDQYPYQVSVQYWKGHMCGGSIISEWFVVTAAHCVHDRYDYEFWVRAGTSTIESEGTLVRVHKIYVHEQFNKYIYDFDIALLQLENPLAFSKSIMKINLPQDDYEVPANAIATVTGWGKLQEGGISPTQLQAVTLPVWARDKCDVQLGGITERMVCAGEEEGGKDSCQGDSGGPMMYENTLVGIVSWGYGCARKGYPGVYSNVGNLRSWIREQTEI